MSDAEKSKLDIAVERNAKIAKIFNEWRPIPRLLVGLYIYLFYKVTMWFMGIPDPTMAQAGFISTIVGSAAAIFGLYVNSGTTKDKDK
tara:strand:- start:9214 stop:9477 length:264 start_codon:yes stop_codon:yes gene_type:complete